MVKQVFNDEGVVYNSLKIIKKVDPRITPAGGKETRVQVECLICGTLKEVAWHKVKSGRIKTCGCVSLGKRKDIKGQVFGMLTAIKSLDTVKKGSILWEFTCECGNIKEITVSQVTSGHFTSCGCMQYKGAPLDLAQQKFGRLTAIQPIGTNKAGQYIWLCNCECGNDRRVVGTQLVEGKSKSCGCYAKEVAGKASTTHGMSSTPEYGAWKNAITRCSDSENVKYKDYGGRGITVCDRWLGDADVGFINFMEDMGPSNGLTLERVNVNKGYSKDNCVWADRFTQGYNTRQHQTNSSGKTGVSENKDGTWQAYINYKGKRYPLGEFKIFEDAVTARENAEIKFYGELKGH